VARKTANRMADRASAIGHQNGWEDARKFIEIDMEELRIWRECYRHRARYIREEAAAKVEGREPKYIPPVVIG
jgi:hypothetical protein